MEAAKWLVDQALACRQEPHQRVKNRVKTASPCSPLENLSFPFLVLDPKQTNPIQNQIIEMNLPVLVADQQSSSEDQLDRLPDELLLVIFQKIHDARSLFRCRCVSKRFSSLVPLVRSLHLSLPRKKPISKPASLFSCFSLFFSKFITRRLCRVKPTTTPSSDSLNRVLRNFKEIDSIHIKLPFYGHDDVDSSGFDTLVKWKAEFGRDLKTCLIMGATSLERINEGEEDSEVVNDGQSELAILSDRELRLRVVWIISSLISASARHHFLKQILSDHPRLGSVVVSDGNNQGKLCMGREQVVEMREALSLMERNSKTLMERTPVPELSIKMSHVRVLELPETGYKMRGATLVDVRALSVGDGTSRRRGGYGDCGFDGDGEEKAFGEAVREMFKVNKSYVMTMNAF